MREITFPLISLGSSEIVTPDMADVSLWIHESRGNTADLITYVLSSSLKSQVSVAVKAAGGDFYAPRIREMLGCLGDSNMDVGGDVSVDGRRNGCGCVDRAGDLDCNNFVTNEFLLSFDSIHDDLRAVKVKGCGFAVPAFSALNLEDRYYHDADEFESAGVQAYKALAREFRDAGTTRTILHTECPGDIELETFSTQRYLWVTPDTEVERVLENSRDIVIRPDTVLRLEDLFDCYTIRSIFILDADKKSLRAALKYMDADEIFVAGYATGSDFKAYWQNLSELKIKANEE